MRIVQDKELIERERALKKKDLEFQQHLCRFARFLQVRRSSWCAEPSKLCSARCCCLRLPAMTAVS